jgi:DNA-binding MarR family transcriptional regulator
MESGLTLLLSCIYNYIVEDLKNGLEVIEICKKIARECIAVRVRLLNRVVTSMYDDAMRPFGLTINQLNILVAISRLGQQNAKQLVRALQMDPSTLSRNLQRMREMGWIRPIPGADARSRKLIVTAKGKRLIEKVFPAWQRVQTQAESLLGNNLNAVSEIASNVWSGPARRV